MPRLETRVGKYLVEYPADMQVKVYNEKWYHGIIFYIGNMAYDLIHNNDMQTERLLISNKTKYPNINMYLLDNDIPFKEATFNFLPAGVSVKEV